MTHDAEYEQLIGSRRAFLAGLGTGGLLAAWPARAFGGDGGGLPRATDLTGGLAPEREFFLTAPPAIEGFTDAASFRIWDDLGRFAFPRISIDAVAPEQLNRMQMTLTLADGRVLRNFDSVPPHGAVAADGLSRILGAGPLRLECVEPYRRYRVSFNGSAVDTSFQALVEKHRTDRRVDVAYDIECTAVAPPWYQASKAAAADELTKDAQQSRVMGGDRFEQLMRVTGWVKIGGVEHRFAGGALRSRRQGIRDSASISGYCWQSALFPSGRGFGYIAYAPREAEAKGYNEGYIFPGKGAILPARVVAAPWLGRMVFDGDDVGITLESASGRSRIEGALVMGAPVLPAGAGLVQLQSIAQFRWDDEIAYGLTDRATLAANIPSRPASAPAPNRSVGVSRVAELRGPAASDGS